MNIMKIMSSVEIEQISASVNTPIYIHAESFSDRILITNSLRKRCKVVWIEILRNMLKSLRIDICMGKIMSFPV